MTRLVILSAIAAMLLSACGKSPESTEQAADSPPAAAADSVFIGANILTMDPDNPDAEAVAVRGQKIIYAGSRAGADELIGDATRVVELGDQALIPGFVDTHGHFMFTSRIIDFANLSSPPVGTANNISDILALLRAHIENQQPAAGDWVIGYGYDDSLLEEKRHPTRADLDKVSTEHPIYLMHVSGHLAAVNSAALASKGTDANTPNPPGGVIRRWPGTQEPNGVMEESAASAYLYERFGEIDQESFAAGVNSAFDYYASLGITTIQDGASNPRDVEAMREMAANSSFNIDLAMFPHADGMDDEQLANFSHEPDYSGGMRIAGVKFLTDGSPQGRTAWVTEPYHELPEGAEEGYVAYPATDIEVYKQRVATLLQKNVPVLVHANGDAAMDAMMDGVEGAFSDGEIPDHRAVIIHAQLMRQDQLDRAATLGVVPSFFSAHTFFWGDWHRRSFGEERASGISPTASALAKGVKFTVHNDAPVVPPDMMRLVWATVNRTTRSGYTLGLGERLSVTEALHAVTLGGAYQYFEEDRKGSLTVGKQADMVILGADPRKVDPATLADIPIVETIARGNTVYSK